MSPFTVDLGYCLFALWLIIHPVVLYWFSYKNVEKLEKLLECSQWVQNHKRQWPSKHFFDLTFRLNCINTLLCFPNKCQARGMVTIAALERISRRQRLTVMFLVNTGYAGFIGLGIWVLITRHMS